VTIIAAGRDRSIPVAIRVYMLPVVRELPCQPRSPYTTSRADQPLSAGTVAAREGHGIRRDA
jgi:hypothetical protein